MERYTILDRFGFCAARLGWPFRERHLRQLAKEALAWRGALLAGNECNAEFAAWVTRSADHVEAWLELTAFDEAVARLLESEMGELVSDMPRPTERWRTVRTRLAVAGVACILAASAWVFLQGHPVSATGELGTQVGKQEEVKLEVSGELSVTAVDRAEIERRVAWRQTLQVTPAFVTSALASTREGTSRSGPPALACVRVDASTR